MVIKVVNTLAIAAVALAPAFAKGHSFRSIANWRYTPVASEFMTDISETSSLSSKISRALDQRKAKLGTSEEGEARMVIAEACEKAGFVYCAYHFAFTTLQDFPGSAPAAWALTFLDRLVSENGLSDRELRRVINSGAFKEVPDSTIPMISYYVAIDNSEKKLNEWVKSATSRLGEANYWRHKWDANLLLREIAAEDAQAGIKKIEAFLAILPEAPKSYERLRQHLQWQLARLKYESQDFSGALEIYQTLPTGTRAGGRVLLERAWSHYSRGEYAETLGLLHSMNSPFFVSAHDPEQYLLEMLTLRQLCHFEAVRGPAEAFKREYEKTLTHIKKRLPLEKDLALARLSFVKSLASVEADTVGLIRLETENLKKTSDLPSQLQKELSTIYSKSQVGLRENLEFALREDLKLEAERVLDLADQIQLVDYLSGLDAYRINQGFQKNSYETTEIPRSDFTTLYWPMKRGEYWYDELGKYQVLVNDRCSGGPSAK